MGRGGVRNSDGRKNIVEVVGMDAEALGLFAGHYEALMGLSGLVVAWLFWTAVNDAFLK